MTMREEKPKAPSQKNKSAKTKSWFWPAVYSGIAIVFVGMIWGYNAFMKEDAPGLADDAAKDPTRRIGRRDERSKGNSQIPIC